MYFNFYLPVYSKNIDQVDESLNGEEYVSFSEFKCFCVYLCIYATMYDSFRKVDICDFDDDSIEGDRRLEYVEWMQGFKKVTNYGFAVFKCMDTPKKIEQVFKSMDEVGNGKVLFKQWCKYVTDGEIHKKTALGKLMYIKRSSVMKKKREILKSTETTLDSKKCSQEDSVLELPLDNGSFMIEKGASDHLRRFVEVFVPYTLNSAKGRELRIRGIKIADSNYNGYCSLAELEYFVKNVLEKEFKNDCGHKIFNKFRHIYIRAYSSARIIDSQDTHAIADDYVGFSEFRMFNLYLCVYAIMYDAFCHIDASEQSSSESEGDKRISSSEWLQNYKKVVDYGFAAFVTINNDDSAKEHFNGMDKDHHGMILFNEWCDYIASAEIQNKSALGILLAKNLNLIRAEKKTQIAITTTQSGYEPLLISGSFNIGKNATENLRDFVRVFQPYSSKEKMGIELRKKGFTVADMSCSRYCSLAELQHFIKYSLRQEFPNERGDFLFKTFYRSYIRAFTSAKALDLDDDDSEADEYVSFKEFRIFNFYLCVYATMFDAFCKIDTSGAWLHINDNDGRIECLEWIHRYKRVMDYGFVAFQDFRDDDEAEMIFKNMDKNSHGIVLFKEWCEYITAAEIHKNTSLGEVFLDNLKLTRSGCKKISPKKTNSLQGLKSDLSVKQLVVSGAFTVGKSVSKDLRDFVSTFLPYADKSVSGRNLRISAFRVADGNCNRFCSLAELECFIQHTLKKNMQSERGNYLFKTFRHSYICAFHAASSISGANSGIICFSEFRVFNTFLCVYGTMYDAFNQLDTHVEFIENKSKDNRIDSTEWLQNYKKVIHHGFVAFDNIKDDKEAELLFHDIDEDSHGMILLKEWCDYITAIEILNKTTLGNMLPVNTKFARVVGKKASKS